MSSQIFSRASILDFFAQSTVSNPPANFARLYYNGTNLVAINSAGANVISGGGGGGSVTSFSSGNLSPLFTTSVATATMTPALSFSLSNAAAHTFFGNNTGSPTAPAYVALTLSDLPSGVGLTANPLSQFAATTSSQLAGVISDETGSGALVFATSPSLVTPVLGTPTSGNLANCTGFPTASLTGLGTGVAAWLATPSSANLATAVTDETGSGALVFANTPTLTTPVIGAATGTSVVLTGVISTSLAGAASSSAVNITGAPFTGGTGTTTFPLVYINSGAAPTNWSTSGTVLGINSPSGFAGRFLDFRANGGSSVFQVGVSGGVTSAADVTVGGSSNFIFSGSSKINAPSNGVLQVSNNAGTDFSRLQFGGTTSSFPAIKRSATTLAFRLADDSADAGFSASTGVLSGKLTTYNNISTVRNGVSADYASSDLTAQSAAIGATTIYAADETAHYRISWSADITTAGSSSSVLGGTNGFQVLYTSPTDSVVKTTVVGNSVTSAANTTGTAVGGSIVVYAKTGTNIQYSYDYTSVGVTAMVFELHITVSKI